MTAMIIDVTPAAYHALPQFSSSLAKTLIAKSPAHAYINRGRAPVEDGDDEEDERPAPRRSQNLDRGTILHRLVLGKGAEYEPINADSWRTNKAKDARDDARAQGKVPVLVHKLRAYQHTARGIIDALAARGYALDGESEVAVLWEYDGVECRAMLDHVWIDRGVILDLKITENASPERVEKTAETLGYAIQYAAYTSALEALRPALIGRVEFVFAFCEPEPPYAINLCKPDGAFREIGYRRWHRALRKWGECLQRNAWPSYGEKINTLSPPAWALAHEEYVP